MDAAYQDAVQLSHLRKTAQSADEYLASSICFDVQQQAVRKMGARFWTPPWPRCVRRTRTFLTMTNPWFLQAHTAVRLSFGPLSGTGGKKAFPFAGNEKSDASPSPELEN